jgi:hypothetical protein
MKEMGAVFDVILSHLVTVKPRAIISIEKVREIESWPLENVIIKIVSALPNVSLLEPEFA